MKQSFALLLLIICVFGLAGCQSPQEKAVKALEQITAAKDTDKQEYVRQLQEFINQTPKEYPAYKKAVNLLTDSLKKDAMLWMKQGRYDRALEVVRLALRVDKTNKELKKMRHDCMDKGDVTEEEISGVVIGMGESDVINLLGNPIEGIEEKKDKNNVTFFLMKYMIELNPKKLAFVYLKENKTVFEKKFFVNKKPQMEYPQREKPPRKKKSAKD